MKYTKLENKLARKLTRSEKDRVFHIGWHNLLSYTNLFRGNKPYLSELEDAMNMERQIRLRILSEIFIIEQHLKTQLYNSFIDKEDKIKDGIMIERRYTRKKYYKNSNAESFHNQKIVKPVWKKALSELKKHKKNFDNLAKDSARSLPDLSFLVNYLTLGNMITLIGNIKEADRATILSTYGIDKDLWKSYLQLIVHFRNTCAHDNKIVEDSSNSTSLPMDYFVWKLGIRPNTTFYFSGLGSLLISIFRFSSPQAWTRFIKDITDILEKHLKTRKKIDNPSVRKFEDFIFIKAHKLMNLPHITGVKVSQYDELNKMDNDELKNYLDKIAKFKFENSYTYSRKRLITEIFSILKITK